MRTTQREWEDLAQVDPLWAVLTKKEKQFGAWDWDNFFATGQREIDDVMRALGLSLGDNGRVLDFGCGVGRLSRALRVYFGEVYGVDISGEMVRLATEYTPSCKFLMNQTNNLDLFDDNFFDFVYSNIVLQHQRNKQIAKAYISEFVRVTKPGGSIVFQAPHKLTWRQALQPRRRLYSLLRTIGMSPNKLYNRYHLNPMRTISLRHDEIEKTVMSAGARLSQSYWNNFNVHSMTYVVQKPNRVS